MKKLLSILFVAGSFFCLMAAVSSHEPKLQKPVVISEPLACQPQGQKLVCFDGAALGIMSCKELGDDTVVCSSQR